MSTTSERWLDELWRQLRRGKHVILHGNVFDLTLFEDEFVAFDDALDAQLKASGYTQRVRYDLTSGLSFSNDATRVSFTALASDTRLETGRQGGYQPPGRAAPVAAPTADGAAYRRPEDALPALIKALESSTVPLAVVIDFSDRLFGNDESAARQDRELTVLLARAFKTARRHVDGPMATMRNAVVLVGSHLGSIPFWVYRDNPLVQLIEVQRPSADVRKRFLEQSYQAFHEPPSTEDAMTATANDWTALTEGMSTWDLESIRLASHDDREPIALSQCRQLIEFFKHGRREDPWEKLDITVIDKARKSLPQQVFGQQSAIDAVMNVLVNARGGISVEGAGRRVDRPKGILFFVGPTGVGKTELAKQLTELIFADPRAFARFDMSEYQAEHAAERLTGAPPSYVGFEQGGQLTNRMKSHPFSLLLFDEIEKAHPRIMDRFLQVLDDGRLTDGRGETVYFGQSIILFTSNIGSATVPRSAEPPSYEALDAHFRQAVADHFLKIGRPELLGRIGEENIVVFDMLRPEAIRPILRKFLQGISASARERFHATVRFDESVDERVVADCQRPENIVLGGRAIRNFVSSHMLPLINATLLKSAPGQELVVWERDAKFVMERSDGR